MFIRKRLVVPAVCAVFAIIAAPLMNVPTAFAVTDDVSILNGPARITENTNSTFFISSMDHLPVECKIDSAAFTPCASNPYATGDLAEGMHTFTVHTINGTNPESTASFTWTIAQPPALVGSSTVTGAFGSPIAITDLQVNDSGNNTATVRLNASGTLQMSTTTGLTFNGASSGSTIEFSGTKNNLNAALATLTFTPTTSGTSTVNAYILGANGDDYSTINGRFFKLVKASSPINWANAKTAAEASTYGGASGYLANITSSQQNEFINQRIPTSSWVGGNDITTEGDWQWSGGPEAGTSFWSGDSTGSAVGGAFTAWRGGMPDNFNGENCLEIEQNLSGAATWNDQNCAQNKNYYVVEYGDGTTIPYASTKQISVTASTDADGDSVANADEQAAPNNGDGNNDGTADSQQANVTSQLDPVSGKYVTLQTSCTSTISAQIGGESAEHKDLAFDYPYGLMDFISTACGAPGSTVAVQMYFYGSADPTTLVARKWNSDNASYAAIPGATTSSVVIGGQAATKVSYSITDGGSLDQDKATDGNVRDPIGLGVALIGAPNTGVSTR